MGVVLDVSDKERRRFRRLAIELVSKIVCEEFDEAIALVEEVGPELGSVQRCGVWSSGMTLLHYAAKSGNAPLVAAMLKTQCLAIDVRDDEGTTPLFAAASLGDVDVVSVLIAYGADVESGRSKSSALNWKSPTALVAAMLGGHEDLTLLLIANGAQVDHGVQDAGGRFLDDIAISKDLAGVYRVLCERGYFGTKYASAMGKVALHAPEKIMDFCLSFEPLASTVAGAKVDQIVSNQWCDRGRSKIMSWRSEQGIAAALGASVDVEAMCGRSSGRSAAPSL